MSEQATLWTIPSVIFSPGSAAGRSPSGSPDGQMTVPSGPDPVLASLSPSPGPEVARQTDDIFGRSSGGSSMSADLQAFMESRLRVLLAETGSPLYVLTWKKWTMQSGPPICALRARARRIFASDYIFVGWATPTVADCKVSSRMPKPSINPDGRVRSRLDVLPSQALLADWATPAARDYKSESATNEFNLKRWSHTRGKPLSAEALLVSGLPTPMAGTPAQNGNNAAGNTDYSRAVVALAGGAARITADGTLLTGCSAGMESGGQLNPAHSRWLQGFPPEWDACAVTATRSSRR